MSSLGYLGKSLVLIDIGSLPLIAQAQTVVETPAVRQDHLTSLRAIVPKPEDLSTGRHVREIKYIALLSAPVAPLGPPRSRFRRLAH